MNPQVGQSLDCLSFSLCSTLCLHICSCEYFVLLLKLKHPHFGLPSSWVSCGLRIISWVFQASGLISTYQWVHTMCVSLRMIFFSSIHLPKNFINSLFNILNHQGNANQNNLEIPPHISQSGWDQKFRWQQMLVRMWRKRNTPPLLMGLETVTTTLEIGLAVPQKIGHSTTGGSCNTTPGHISRR